MTDNTGGILGETFIASKVSIGGIYRGITLYATV